MARYAELGIEMLEKANANLEPGFMSQKEVEHAFELYSRAERLVAYGKTMLAPRMDEAKAARLGGTSIGKAKAVVATGNPSTACRASIAATASGQSSTTSSLTSL
ncbi:MAG: hypothetical protein ACR2KQ_06025 [Actinomycetota bacterium]|jgi:hypothetical protein